MKHMFPTLVAALATTALSAPAPAQQAPKRPNFLVIVADDLGFSDIGAFGGEIDTPNLDALALSGLRLTGFHTAPACSPTRAMLLTGSDSHRVGLGAMAEVTQDNQRGRPGFEGYLRADAPTLAERLSANGYRTLYSGKWHLGLQPGQDPSARGFQHSFALLPGGHNHFGIGISADPASGTSYREDGVPVTTLPADFYSSDYFADKLVRQITDTRAGADGGKPFFAYLAFTAPHFPLQAPAETVARYKGRYDAGYEVLRAQRIERQRQLGLVAPTTVPHPLVAVPRWDALSPQEKQLASREMEIYAAMVDRLDKAVGRVVAALKATGEFENTVILFLSDNGAEGMDLATSELPTVRRLARSSSFDAIGTAASYVSYGAGWAQAATAPSYRFKAYATEGGTRTVSFISGPAVARPRTISNAYTHVTDVTPTFLQLAGVPVAAGGGGAPTQPIDGLSWAPLLKSGAPVYPRDRPVGNELFGSRSIREGDWKITDISDGRWRLFDIAADPGETTDLSDREPGRKAALIRAWDDYARRVGVVLPSPRLHPHGLQPGE